VAPKQEEDGQPPPQGPSGQGPGFYLGQEQGALLEGVKGRKETPGFSVAFPSRGNSSSPAVPAPEPEELPAPQSSWQPPPHRTVPRHAGHIPGKNNPSITNGESQEMLLPRGSRWQRTAEQGAAVYF